MEYYNIIIGILVVLSVLILIYLGKKLIFLSEVKSRSELELIEN
jgi:hypothetical protein